MEPPQIPPVPPIPPQFTSSTPTTPSPIPIPNSKTEQQTPNFRSLSYSKPTILKFKEFPNMNLAFYLDLDSPNDVANLPDSVVVSPRLEMVRRRERELKKDQRVDSAVCLEEPAGDRAEVQVHEGQERRHSLKDERLESAGFEGSVGDQVQHQQHHRLKHTSSEGVSLGGVIRDQAQHQPHQVSKDRKLESEAFNRAEDQAQLLQQQHVLKDKRLKSALLDEAIEVQLRSRSQSQNIRQQQHVLKANMDQTTKIWFPSIPGRERVVTFNLKGWKPDTKIMVFGEKFHVHSVVLLLHSAFFRGLLDAMDAESGISTANTVQYNLDSGEWVPPKRGRDVVWTLQKAVEKPQPLSPPRVIEPEDWCIPSTDLNPLSLQSKEIAAFTDLVHAFYNKPYQPYSLCDLASFETLVRVATQFGSLPCLSSSLYMTLWKCPSFIPYIRQDPEKVLLLAFRLRNSLLFREALVHVVSKWKGWHELFEGEHRLICSITKARNDVLEKVLCVNRGVFNIVASGEDHEKEDMLEVLRESSTGNYVTRWFFEKLLDFVGCGEGKAFNDAVRDLVGSKLVLEPFASGVVEDNRLMCAEIEDADLPWDLDEEDW